MMRKKVNKNLDFNKRAVSAVVATVLIILITVAAVAIIWTAVIPMVRENISPSKACLDAVSQVGLGTEEGYTCRKSDDSGLKLQITRGEKDFELAGVQVMVSIGGNTYSTEYTGDMPDPNEEKVIEVAADDFDLPQGTTLSEIEKIEIAPIVKVGGTTKTCGTSASTRVIPTCSE